MKGLITTLCLVVGWVASGVLPLVGLSYVAKRELPVGVAVSGALLGPGTFAIAGVGLFCVVIANETPLVDFREEGDVPRRTSASGRTGAQGGKLPW